VIKRAAASAVVLTALCAAAAHAVVEPVAGVTLSTTTGLRTSIALDNQNTVHLAYFDPTDQKVKYTQRLNGGAGWSTPELVDTLNHTHSTQTAMALDVSRTPHVVFYDETDTLGPALKYTRRLGGTWQTPSTIEIFDSSAPFVALALGPDNQPRVLYSHAPSTSTKLGVFSGVSWSTYTVMMATQVAAGDILVESNGRVHAAMNVLFAVNFSTYHVLSYMAETTPGSGSFAGLATIIGSSTTEPGNVSLALDSGGIAHISAFDEFNEDLWYFRGTPSALSQPSTVTATGTVGRNSAILLDSMGRPRIAFTDEGVGLQLAGCSLAPCANASWSVDVVPLDPDDTAGAGIDLTRNSLNSFFGSYFDGTVPELRFVTTAATGLSISGTVTDGAGGTLTGVTVSFAGNVVPTAAVTPGAGTYSFTNLLEGVYVLTPSFPGYGFEPASRSISPLTSNATAQDFAGGPVGFEEIDNLIDPTLGQSVTLTASVLTGNLFVGVYTLNGRLVRTLVDEHKTIGSYTLTWDGRNANGEAVASGIYLVRANGVGVKTVRKVAVVK
jgi:hypothetical protein